MAAAATRGDRPMDGRRAAVLAGAGFTQGNAVPVDAPQSDLHALRVRAHSKRLPRLCRASVRHASHRCWSRSRSCIQRNVRPQHSAAAPLSPPSLASDPFVALDSSKLAPDRSTHSEESRAFVHGGRYRADLVRKLPQLRLLDHVDVTGKLAVQ